MYHIAIADDEDIVRKGLKSLIPWDSIDCCVTCEARDGLELLEALKQKVPVDIIITDIKMPRMDGIELCRRINMTAPHIPIIMLTAYADFEYARQAIKYGVTDYITKNGGMKEIQSAVVRSIHQLEEQRLLQSSLEVQGKNIAALQCTFIKNVFDGLITDPQALRTRREQLHFSLNQYAVLCIEFDSNRVKPWSQKQDSLPSFTDFITSAFKAESCWCVPVNQQIVSILVSALPGEALLLGDVKRTCSDIIHMLETMLELPVFIGISAVSNEPDSLITAYEQARGALNRRFMEDGSSLYLYEENSRKMGEDLTPVNEALDALFFQIRNADASNALQVLERLFLLQKSHNIPAEMLKSQALLINSRCNRILAEGHSSLDHIYEREITFYQTITACRSLEEYKSTLRPVVTAACEALRNSPAASDSIIPQVTAYINAHFTEDINLNDIAAAVHVTPSYLSRIYKKATGRTVINDVNALKIDLAKKLL